MNFSTQNVKSAIRILLDDPNSSTKLRQEADSFLIKFQSLPDAWEIAAKLLIEKESTITEKFFASQTLYHKINNDWVSLKDEQKEQLRILILESLIKYSTVNQLLKRLSVTFSMFVLFSISEIEKLKDIFEFFSLKNTQMNIKSHLKPEKYELDVRNSVLEWITVLPEQIDSCNLIQAKKAQIHKILNQQQIQILQYLLNYLSSTENNLLKNKALKGLRSWTELGIPLELVYSEQGIILTLFECLKDRSLFIETSLLLDDILTLHPNTKYNDVLLSYMKRLIEFASLYQHCLEKRDDEIAYFFVSLISSFGETQYKLMSDNDTIGLKYIEFLLYLTQHPSKKISKLTFDFWFVFQQSLETQQQKEKYKKIIIQFIQIVLKQIQYENDDLDEEDDDLDDYRYYACDTLLASFNILFDNYFKLLESILTQCLNNWNVNKDYKQLEAIFVALYAVSDSAKDRNHLKSLNIIFQILPKIPNEIHLSKSIIKFIGSYSDYIVTLDPNFNSWCIQFCLSLICNKSINQSVSKIAGKVFVQLCESSATIHNEDLVKNLVNGCKENISSLSNDLILLIYEGLSYQINSIQKNQKLQFEMLNLILFPISKNVEMMFNQKNSENSIIFLIECFKMSLTGFDGGIEQIPLSSILTQIWPLFEKIFVNYSQNENLIHILCELISMIIVSIGNTKANEIFLNQIFEFLIYFYENFSYHFLLNTLKLFIEPEEKNCLMNDKFILKYQRILLKSYVYISKNDGKLGDLLNSFFKFLERIGEFHPYLLINKESEKIFELCFLFIDYQENQNLTNSIYLFLKIFLRNSKNLSKEKLDETVLQFSGKLIESILVGIVERDSINSRELINIIDIYNTKYPMLLRTHLWNFFLNPNHQRIKKLTKTRIEIFVKTILKNRGISKLRKEFNQLKLEIISNSL
eukprot:gene531-8043_t